MILKDSVFKSCLSILKTKESFLQNQRIKRSKLKVTATARTQPQEHVVKTTIPSAPVPLPYHQSLEDQYLLYLPSYLHPPVGCTQQFYE